MADTERKNLDPKGAPQFQLNIVELHLNIGFPTLVFGPVMAGAQAVERGLKRFMAEPEPDRARLAKKQAVA